MLVRLLIIAGTLVAGLILGFFVGSHRRYPKIKSQGAILRKISQR